MGMEAVSQLPKSFMMTEQKDATSLNVRLFKLRLTIEGVRLCFRSWCITSTRRVDFPEFTGALTMENVGLTLRVPQRLSNSFDLLNRVALLETVLHSSLRENGNSCGIFLNIFQDFWDSFENSLIYWRVAEITHMCGEKKSVLPMNGEDVYILHVCFYDKAIAPASKVKGFRNKAEWWFINHEPINHELMSWWRSPWRAIADRKVRLGPT